MNALAEVSYEPVLSDAPAEILEPLLTPATEEFDNALAEVAASMVRPRVERAIATVTEQEPHREPVSPSAPAGRDRHRSGGGDRISFAAQPAGGSQTSAFLVFAVPGSAEKRSRLSDDPGPVAFRMPGSLASTECGTRRLYSRRCSHVPATTDSVTRTIRGTGSGRQSVPSRLVVSTSGPSA